MSRAPAPDEGDDHTATDGAGGAVGPEAGEVPATVRDRVREDSDLTPAEKETSLGFTKRDDYARVYTAEAGLARRLLAHPEVRVVGVTVDEGDDRRREVDVDAVDDEAIVGVRCDVPVGAVKIGASVRASGGHADVVTDRVLREDAEGGGRADE